MKNIEYVFLNNNYSRSKFNAVFSKFTIQKWSDAKE